MKKTRSKKFQFATNGYLQNKAQDDFALNIYHTLKNILRKKQRFGKLSETVVAR